MFFINKEFASFKIYLGLCNDDFVDTINLNLEKYLDIYFCLDDYFNC